MMGVARTTVILLFIIQKTTGSVEEAVKEESLWCYECGTGVVGAPDCEAFVRASSWASFWRECPSDYTCVKSLPSWPTQDESRVVRGCSPKVNIKGTTHKEGCWGHPSTTGTITCFCHTTLCNAAHTTTMTPFFTPSHHNNLLIFLLFILGVVLR